MDFGDLQNHRTGKKAEEAARAAQENSWQIQQLQNSISQQHAAQEREQLFNAALYELSIELDNDFRTLSFEPTEDAAERIAERYSRNPIDELLDHNNYSALEYKELASKTGATFKKLQENAWFQRGAKKVYPQIEEENRIAQEHLRKQEQARLMQRKEKRRVQERNSLLLIAFIMTGCALFFFCAVGFNPQIEPDEKITYGILGGFSGLIGVQFGVAAYKKWKK